MLGEVLFMNNVMLEGGVTRKINPSTVHLTLGHINTVLVLEDHGPIGQLKDGTSLASVQPPAITTAHKNLTSAETVPTWTSHVVPQANYNY